MANCLVMADKNRRKEVEGLLEVLRQPGHSVPVQELTEYLRLVGSLHKFKLVLQAVFCICPQPGRRLSEMYLK